MEPSPNEPAVTEWIGRGARGDETACAALFHEFYPSVVRLSLGLLNDLADAEEVAQDTFVYALRNLGRYEANLSAFRTWLFTIALSRCRNKRRRKSLLQGPLELLAGELPATPRAVEVALERRGLRRQLWQALQSLSEPVREAVVLRYLGEMRYKEVGATLACSPKTAESRVRLGVEALRRALTAQGVALDWQLAEAPA